MRELLYESFISLARRMDIDGIQKTGDVLGHVLWATLASRRKRTCKAVSRHLDVDSGQARKIAHKSFCHTGRGFLELLVAPSVDWRFIGQRIEIGTPKILKTVQETDRPVVIATCHLGSWELTVGLLKLFFPNKQRMILGRKPKDLALNEVITHLRNRPGVKYVTHRDAMFPVLKILKRGGVFATLVDHNSLHDEAVFLPFLNDIAAVNKGPALLAVRTGALVLPVAMPRLENGRFRLVCEEPLDTRELTGSNDEKVREVARFYTRNIENFIRAWPEQWMWLHKRWKTRPKKDDLIG